VGAEGFERPTLSPEFVGKFGLSEPSAQAHTQLDTQSSDKASPELTRLVAAWEKLPGHIQKTILTLVDAHEPSPLLPFENPEHRVA
jgi:hypothetical protein